MRRRRRTRAGGEARARAVAAGARRPSLGGGILAGWGCLGGEAIAALIHRGGFRIRSWSAVTALSRRAGGVHLVCDGDIAAMPRKMCEGPLYRVDVVNVRSAPDLVDGRQRGVPIISGSGCSGFDLKYSF
jgi:hypothetical protein